MLNYETVKKLQCFLAGKMLYDGPIDGVFSDKTLTSFKTFQRLIGHKIDGVYDDKIQKCIDAIMENDKNNENF